MRDWWHRNMDPRRAMAVALGVVAYGLLILALAVTPGLVVSTGGDAAWWAWTAPALGGASGAAIRGYAFHRRPGPANGLRWGLAQGGLMLLVFLGMFALAVAANPIASSNPMLGGDAWLGLLAVGSVFGLTSSVLWERDGHRQRIAVVLLAAVCLIIAGVASLRAGGPGTPAGTAFLAVGVLGVAAAALQGLSQLVQATADPTA